MRFTSFLNSIMGRNLFIYFISRNDALSVIASFKSTRPSTKSFKSKPGITPSCDESKIDENFRKMDLESMSRREGISNLAEAITNYSSVVGKLDFVIA
jgi:hypothetical protein